MFIRSNWNVYFLFAPGERNRVYELEGPINEPELLLTVLSSKPGLRYCIDSACLFVQLDGGMGACFLSFSFSFESGGDEAFFVHDDRMEWSGMDGEGDAFSASR